VISHLHFLTLGGLRDMLADLEGRNVDWDRWLPDEVIESVRP
jgi:hypothetical protein